MILTAPARSVLHRHFVPFPIGNIHADQQEELRSLRTKVDENRGLVERQIVQAGLDHEIFILAQSHRHPLRFTIDLAQHGLRHIRLRIEVGSSDDSLLTDSELNESCGFPFEFAGRNRECTERHPLGCVDFGDVFRWRHGRQLCGALGKFIHTADVNAADENAIVIEDHVAARTEVIKNRFLPHSRWGGPDEPCREARKRRTTPPKNPGVAIPMMPVMPLAEYRSMRRPPNRTEDAISSEVPSEANAIAPGTPAGNPIGTTLRPAMQVTRPTDDRIVPADADIHQPVSLNVDPRRSIVNVEIPVSTNDWTVRSATPIGATDAWSPESGKIYSGTVHARTIDAGTINARTVDVGTVDARTIDTRSIDTRAIDARSINARSIDTRIDAGTIDTGTIDAGTIDTGTIDTGSIDAGTIDAGTIDAWDD